jgi:hypothetical protein
MKQMKKFSFYTSPALFPCLKRDENFEEDSKVVVESFWRETLKCDDEVLTFNE